MKTIVRNFNRASLYLYSDDTPLYVYADRIVVGDNPPSLIIGDCNEGNCTIYNGVTAPDDWIGEKYLFDGITWIINPDYIYPEEQESSRTEYQINID